MSGAGAVPSSGRCGVRARLRVRGAEAQAAAEAVHGLNAVMRIWEMSTEAWGGGVQRLK